MVINQNSQRLDRIFDLVRVLHPDRVLARGFSITRDHNGEIVRNEIAAGNTIFSETDSSVITSTVTESKPRETKEAT